MCFRRRTALRMAEGSALIIDAVSFSWFLRRSSIRTHNTPPSALSSDEMRIPHGPSPRRATQPPQRTPRTYSARRTRIDGTRPIAPGALERRNHPSRYFPRASAWAVGNERNGGTHHRMAVCSLSMDTLVAAVPRHTRTHTPTVRGAECSLQAYVGHERSGLGLGMNATSPI